MTAVGAIRLLPALLLTFLAFAVPVRTFAQAPSPAIVQAPEAAVQAFYHNYLKLLVANKEPRTDDPTTYKAYVSKPLAREIERKIKGPDGLEADYFIQAQDYLDGWESNVAVSPARIDASQARTTVTLTAATGAPYRLAVTLIREDGAWRIRKVARS